MEGRDTLRRIEDDDPNVVDLVIGSNGNYPAPDVDWERLGNAISKSTYLRKLWINIAEVAAEDLTVFFGKLSNNTMLRELNFICEEIQEDPFDISCFDEDTEEALRSLLPIFKNNKGIERLKICCTPSCLHLLASALTEANSLKALELWAHFFYFSDELEERGDRIMKALSGHRRLEELIFRHVPIGRDGFSLLADMLQNQDSKLAVLHLNGIQTINNENAYILAKGLAGSSTLRDLLLAHTSTYAHGHDISEKVWRDIFCALKSPSSKLEKLSLPDSNAVSVAGIHLFDALANSRTLKALDLSSEELVMARWLALSEYLQSPTCQLEEIELTSCGINNESMECFSNSMINNSSVKKLGLSMTMATYMARDPTITPTYTGWVAFSAALQSPASALESLDLSYSSMDDSTIEIFCNGIYDKNNLKELDISWNEKVTSEGWRISVPHLLKTSLEKLDLSNNCIELDMLESYLPALANNTTLKTFLVENDGAQLLPASQSLDTGSLAMFSSILCNGSSITNTHESNHSLQELIHQWSDSVLPDTINSLLHINRHSSKSQAARLKIVQTHFGEGFIAAPFTGMDIKLLPHAIAWMSKAVGGNGADGRVYGFVKDFLFQNAGDHAADQGRM